MNKEMQIEEMAEDLENTILGLGIHLCEKSAEKLYDLGYRKVDDENYVGREWHDEQVLILAGEIDELKEQLAEYQKPIDKFIKDRKQAVKEFAGKLWNKIKDNGIDYKIGLRALGEEIDELLKEYEE